MNNINSRNKYANFVTKTGIVINLILFAAKLTTGILASSVAIIGDALNNITDSAASFVAFLGFSLSGKHADKKHPLGHGRMEYVSTFIVDILIILVGIELIKTAFGKIISPDTAEYTNLSLIILILSAVVKLFMFFFYKTTAKKINSTTIHAAATDSICDVFVTSTVLISAVISQTLNIYVDGYAALIVALFIIYTGFKACKDTVELLMGATPSPKLLSSVENVIKKYPDVIGIHDFMAHEYGPTKIVITFHAEVSENIDLSYAHEIIDNIENELEKEYCCIATIHIDPVTTDNEYVREKKALAEECARETDENFSIHDFRITGNENNKKMIFDLSIPIDSKFSDEDAARLVREKLAKKCPDYTAIIRAEHPYF